MEKSEPGAGGISATEEGKKTSFPVVAIGASAGGLEALQSFFEHMPPDSGMAFAVVQHLASSSKSMLGDILSRHTKMRVLQIEDGMAVEPDHVYIAPAKTDVAVMESVFLIKDTLRTSGVKLPIDYFFRSLAEDQREKSICIILSGTGSDGTQGLRAIKEQGGMAIVQDVHQAKFDNMPQSAISTGLADFILPVEKMSRELISYAAHSYLQTSRKKETNDTSTSAVVQEIIVLLRSKTGRDFIHYKQKTIRRRIERRMALHKIETMLDYLGFLRETPQEMERLSREFLIGVTSFFRDEKAFEALKEKAVKDIIQRKQHGVPIRIWVPGCSTGEEALSIAMLFSESMEEMQTQFVIQIFATDVDRQAIERARLAEYPDSIAADISEKRLRKFFVKTDGLYKAKSEIREMVVYAVQDINNDPPFSKLDLISCRNLLIYLDTVLQRRIIPLFHYTLNPRAYLFLGSSETVGGFGELFSSTDVKWKIYQSREFNSGKAESRTYSADTPVIDSNGVAATFGAKYNSTQIMERLVLDEYAPASIIFDSKANVTYFRGQTQKYLELPDGEATFNLQEIAREGLRHKLPAALQNLFRERSSFQLENVQVKFQGVTVYFDMILRPLGDSADLFTAVFLDRSVPPPPRRRRKAQAGQTDPRTIELELELQATKESLQTTIEEMNASNEELKSANEELQSTNEELQSTNEEVETTKEELQSTNEELVTLNSELQSRVDEFGELNNDIDNLLASTEIGTIFLDGDLLIKRFTPSMTKLFSLIAGDVGRSIRDITSIIDSRLIYREAEEVLKTLQISQLELKADDEKWFFMRILPYRTRANLVDGVVITFSDITGRKLMEQQLIAEKMYSEAIIDTIRESLLIIDSDLRVISANKSFYRSFKTTPAEIEGKPIYELETGKWDIPEFRKLLEKILPENCSFEDFEIQTDSSLPGTKDLFINARKVVREDAKRELILVAIEERSSD